MPSGRLQPLDYHFRNPRPGRRWQRLILAACWLYPLIVPGAFYATWLAAWAMLGHRPRPSIDDPWRISWIVSVLGWAAVGLFVSVLFAAGPAIVMGMVLGVTWARARKGDFTASALKLVVLYFGSLVLLIWDPFGVLRWFIDW